MTSQWQTTNEQLWNWYGILGYVFAFLREEHILYRVTESTHKEVNQCSKAKGVTQTQQIPGSPTVAAHKLHQRYIRRYDLLREVFFLSTTDCFTTSTFPAVDWKLFQRLTAEQYDMPFSLWPQWLYWHRRLNQFFEDPDTEKVKENGYLIWQNTTCKFWVKSLLPTKW